MSAAASRPDRAADQIDWIGMIAALDHADRLAVLHILHTLTGGRASEPVLH